MNTSTAKQLLQKARRLSTGCEIIDSKLGGGIPALPITEICGEAGVGKTQLLLSLALTAQLPVDKGGLGGGVLYLCTEGSVPVTRLKDILDEKPELKEKIGEQALDHILLEERIDDAEALWRCIYERIPCLLEAGFVKLVIIDSIAALFRGEFSGRESMHDRNSWFFGLSAKMKQLASLFDCCFIVSNQISFGLDAGAKRAALGLVWSACINQRIVLDFAESPESINLWTNLPHLRNVSPRRRTISVELSPVLPSGMVYANCVVSKRGFHGL